MGALIGGIAVSSLISAISGYMGSSAQAEAYEKLAEATEKEREMFQKYYDQAYGEGSYNDQIQKLGLQAENQYYNILNDESAWDKYINGSEAYEAPETFSFTAEDLYSDPSYEFRLNSGLDALEDSLASQGYAGSGYAAKEMNNYAQNAASQEYSNAYNRAYKQYTDDRDFDYTAWKNEANQYYQNLTNKLSGLDKVSTNGINANSNQAQALSALAQNEASALQQQATAEGAANTASTSGLTSILDSLAKGINNGVGLYASTNGANANTNTTNTNSTANYSNITSNPATSSNGTTSSDYLTALQNMVSGWNYGVSNPTTSTLTGA